MLDPLDRLFDLQGAVSEVDNIIELYNEKVQFISKETKQGCRIRLSYAEEAMENIENILKLYRGEK